MSLVLKHTVSEAEARSLFEQITAAFPELCRDTPPPQPDTPESIGQLIIHDRFKFGSKSVANLQTLHPSLAATAMLALRITEQDFTVFETHRTLTRQREMVANGTSQTLQSKHLIQPSGKAHAMDLVPWIGGKAVWDWDGCYKIAFAVDVAATHLGHANNIRWGGAWDRVLSDFGGRLELYKQETENYRARRGGKAFLDGPHFEWVA